MAVFICHTKNIILDVFNFQCTVWSNHTIDVKDSENI